jgi:hypothetical protein
MLVSLEEVRLHSRITHSVEDDDLVAKISDASAAVLTYLGSRADFLQSDGEPDFSLMPRQVRQATLKLVESFFTDRGGGGGANSEWTYNYLPPAVVALLYPLRDPAAC